MNCDHCNRHITNRGDDKVVFFRMEDICRVCWSVVREIMMSDDLSGFDSRPLFTGADINGCARVGV